MNIARYLLLQIVAAVLIFAVLYLVPRALAAPPATRPLHTVRVAESLRIAAAYWGRPAPCRVHVYATAPRALDAWIGGGALDGRAGNEATLIVDPANPPADCDIYLADDLATPGVENRVLACTYLVHAYGHVLGLPDVADGRTIMRSPDTPIAAGCWRRFTTHAARSTWRHYNGAPVLAASP